MGSWWQDCDKQMRHSAYFIRRVSLNLDASDAEKLRIAASILLGLSETISPPRSRVRKPAGKQPKQKGRVCLVCKNNKPRNGAATCRPCERRNRQSTNGQQRARYARPLDECVQSIGFTSYNKYLESELWKAIRLRVMSAKPDCELCGRPSELVHHQSYSQEALRGEETCYLVSCCRKCHRIIHFDDSGGKRRFKEAVELCNTLLVRCNESILIPQ